MKRTLLVLTGLLSLVCAARAGVTFTFEGVVTSSPDPAIAVPGDIVNMEFTLLDGAENEHPDPRVAFNSSQLMAVSAYLNGVRFPDLIFDQNRLAVTQQPSLDTAEWIGGVPGTASVRAFMRFPSGTFPDFPAVDDILNNGLLVLANASSLNVCYTLLDCIDANPIVNYAYTVDAVDTDGDSVADAADNCTDLPNPGQVDTDGDLIGNVCDPDIAAPSDCQVNFADLIEFKQALFSTPADPNWNPDADLTGPMDEGPDGSVNFADLQRAKQLFFGPPGPSAAGCN